MVELLNIDCMEYMKTLPDQFFDLAIVDPPYGLGLDMVVNNGSHGKGKNAAGEKRKTIHDKKGWNDNIPGPEYFEELHRVSRHQIIWGCNYYAKYIPAVGRIVHDKKMSIEGTNIYYSHADLASCSLQKRITIFRYQWSGNNQGGGVNWDNTGPDRRIHPTQKPIALYKYLLSEYSQPGWKIFDSHLGSGSIAIACQDMAMDLVACEIDPEYYNQAKKRLQNHVKQLQLL